MDQGKCFGHNTNSCFDFWNRQVSSRVTFCHRMFGRNVLVCKSFVIGLLLCSCMCGLNLNGLIQLLGVVIGTNWIATPHQFIG